MQVPFRQGLVRHQVDNNSAPAFLQKISGGQYINLVISPTPVVICFSHFDTDYLYEETRSVNKAWGPFSTSTDKWLFWDINVTTGARTFGYTELSPIISPNQPANPAVDQHWYNTLNTSMFVWNGTRWEDVIRCFAAKYDNSAVILPYSSGSQVGITIPVQAGFILFDDDEKPIKKWRRDNRGVFLTTESPIITHASRVSNVILDGATKVCVAQQNIPQWSVVSFSDFNSVILGSHLDKVRPAAGISKWNMNVGDIGTIHTSGYITNNNWNWTFPASTPLFVGLSGQLTPIVPQFGSIQRVGMIVDSDTIFVDIGMHVILDES